MYFDNEEIEEEIESSENIEEMEGKDDYLLESENDLSSEDIKEFESNYSVLDNFKTKKNMYFDEERIKDLIINHYQPYLDYEINEKGKKVCVSRERASKEVEKEIMGNLFLIAKAIINKYRFWKFEPMEDLQAESLRAMWVYLPNFVPGKGTVFNLFSIICKHHLINYTLNKNYKHRITQDIDNCYSEASVEAVNYTLFFDNLEKVFLDIINRNYVGEKRRQYKEITSILIDYLVKHEKIVGKNDLLATFKEWGYKSTTYKKFIDDMSKYKYEFFELIK